MFSGRLDVGSTNGKGTALRVFELLNPRGLGRSEMFKILLVEDNKNCREAFKEHLSLHFPQVVIEEAVDGRQAMEKLKDSQAGLIFMDINLPDESGLQLTRKIKAQYPDINVIILTSYDLPEYRDAAIRFGATDFLVKGSSDDARVLSFIKSHL